jgi:hypothetical protein
VAEGKAWQGVQANGACLSSALAGNPAARALFASDLYS